MAPTFADLGVPEPIVAVLDRARIRSPFPVQAATIPDLLEGRDLVGRAPTGSGKTLAFGIPMVAEVERAEPRNPTALVLAPTRELAEQIAVDLREIATAMDRKILAVYGGVGLEPQIKKLRQGIDILVATPGRLEDLIARRAVALGAARILVIDEADRMADMGFMPVVKRLIDQTPRTRQTVLYSATLDGDVGKLIERYQRDPSRYEIGPATPDLHAMQHHFWELPRPERLTLCASVIATFGRTIVFSRTRHGADRLARQLSRLGVDAVAIHGNRSQSQRTRALADFSAGRAHALVATDVAARGIHVDDVACVLHYDPVDEDSAYVHRSGRTARAGAHGHVVSFVDPGQVRLVKGMIHRLELDVDITAPPDAEWELPDPGPDADRAADARTERPRGDRARSSTNRRPQGNRGTKPKGKNNTSRNAKANGNATRNGNASGGAARRNGGRPGQAKRKGSGSPSSGGRSQGGRRVDTRTGGGRSRPSGGGRSR